MAKIKVLFNIFQIISKITRIIYYQISVILGNFETYVK